MISSLEMGTVLNTQRTKLIQKRTTVSIDAPQPSLIFLSDCNKYILQIEVTTYRILIRFQSIYRFRSTSMGLFLIGFHLTKGAHTSAYTRIRH